MPHSLTVRLLIAALFTLGGCGQTGPLYMPGETPPGSRTTDSGNAEAATPQTAPVGTGSDATATPQTDPGDSNNVDDDPLITP